MNPEDYVGRLAWYDGYVWRVASWEMIDGRPFLQLVSNGKNYRRYTRAEALAVTLFGPA